MGETFITDNIILKHFSLNGEIYFLLLILKKNYFNITINVQLTKTRMISVSSTWN